MSADRESLSDVIENEAAKLAQYKADGFESVPLAAVVKLLVRVSLVGAPFTDWLSEGEAKLRSSRTEQWLRAQFPAWETQGLARWHPAKPKQRQYLRCAVPMRANPAAAREDGRRVELGA